MVRLALLFGLFALNISFQKLCGQITASQQTLIDVNEYIDRGLLTEAKEELNRCQFKKLSRQDKMEYYRLKGITYLLDDNVSLAGSSIENLLRLNPKYREHPGIDPFIFTDYLSDFKIRRGWVATIGMGVQHTSKRFTSKRFHLIGSNETVNKTSRLNQEYYIGTGYHFSPFLNLYMSYILGNNQLSEEFSMNDGTLYKMDHWARYHGFELINQFYVNKDKLNYLFTLGIGSQFLFDSYNQFESIRNNQPSYATQEVSEKLNNQQPYLTLGAGVELPVNNDKIFIHVSYRGFLTNYYQDARRFEDLNSIIDYQYIPDSYFLQQTTINMGYKKVLRYKIKR